MKGQSSVEFLVIFAVAVALITATIIISQGHIGGVVQVKEENDARNSLFDISAAAKEVYAQGEGARKQVYIYLPSSYEPAEAYVGDRTIKLRARGSDFVSVEEFDVHGSLPGTDGPHWVWVISEGNKVRIGSAMITLSRNSIYVMMKANSTRSTSFSVESIWNRDISVDSDVSWNHDDVSMSVSTTTFSLSPAESENINLDFTSGEDAAGIYSGSISYTATDNGNTETVKLPITVEVVGSGKGMAPPLTVIPSFWNETMLAGGTATKAFTVCTNIETAPTSVTFSPSAGYPGSWVGSTMPLGPMAAGSCQVKILNMTVPPGTDPSIYSGSVHVVGQGVAGAEDTISLLIYVGGDPTDSIGPIVTDVFHMPTKIYDEEPVTFVITATDANRGNNTIKGCEMSPNFVTWLPMEPTDGTFDSITEQATIRYMPGFMLGTHTIRFRCTDFRDNVGPEESYTIKVMKNFLFVTKTGTPGSDEQDWISWVASHSSSEGFNWHFDTAPDATIADDLIDTSFYSVMVLADYKFASTIPPKLKNYISEGGRVVFIGRSFQQGPRDMGYTTSPGTSGGTDVFIVTDIHYITEDYNSSQTLNLYNGSGGSDALKNYIGGKLGTTDSTLSTTILGDGSGCVVWGPRTPAAFSSDGVALSKKIFDYSLLQSTIMPG